MDIWVAILLIVFGLIFLLLEFFVFPGVGISGLLGVISLVSGIVIAFYLNTFTGYVAFLGSGIAVGILTYIAYKFDTLSMMSLKREIKSKVAVNHLEDLKVNDEGVTISRLAPMGKAQFSNYLVEVQSYDGFVDENTKIRIELIKDNTIFVTNLK